MIKRTPADFQVEEILSSDFTSQKKDEGPFALYRLEKQSLATPEAVGQLARALKAPAASFAYAGLKDKHASTIQYVTLKLAPEIEAPPTATGPGWKIEKLGFVPRSITASDIEQNRFSITLRNLAEPDSKDIDSAIALLRVPDAPSSVRIVNYFGDQRFGSARHGRGFLAKDLIKGDFEAALKLAIATEARKDRMDQKVFKRTLLENWGQWKAVLPKLRPCPERRAIERLVNSSGDFRAAFCALPYLLQQLSVYAYQSFLWNAIARRMIESTCVPNGKVIAADDPFGEMLFPEAAAIPPDLVALELPLLARNTVLAEPWKDAAERILGEEGIAVTELHIPGVRRPFFGEEPRRLFFEAREMTCSLAKTDETSSSRRLKRTLNFTLPRGCYATVLLRALGQ